MRTLKDYMANNSPINETASNAFESTFQDEEPMIVFGDFEQAKSQISAATRYYNRNVVIWRFLDKTSADDFKPIKIHGKNVYPDWAASIIDNKDTDFVLVFDVTNISNEVWNALMPVILENRLFNKNCDNLYCICYSENKEISMPKPIESKLRKIDFDEIFGD